MKKIFTITLMAVMAMQAFAQDKESEPKFGITFKGFVKNDITFDSRQTVSAREGHLLLWPAAVSEDFNGVDINAAPNFNMFALQTRLTGVITGPDAFGAKTSGVIEGAFFGHSNADLNEFRLRHAFGKLSWETTELMFGQYWHPMFITDCFPGTVSFNTGLPFQPFSRNPQVRLTQHFGGLSIMVAALSQIDFTGAGGSAELRNSASPDWQAQLSYSIKSEDGFELLAGAGAGFKTIRPRLSTALNFVEDARVPSLTSMAYLKLKVKPVTVKMEGVLGQNTYDIMGISSYASTSVDLLTNTREYTATGSAGGWIEVQTNGTGFQAGIFAGYVKNTGAKETILPGTVAGTRGNIDNVTRVSPRLIYNAGKVRFALEYEMTSAGFGDIQNDGTVDNVVSATNHRTLLAAYYFF